MRLAVNEKPEYQAKKKKQQRGSASNREDSYRIESSNKSSMEKFSANDELFSRHLEKKERNLFKKLYYLNSSRILQIVGYVPS